MRMRVQRACGAALLLACAAIGSPATAGEPGPPKPPRPPAPETPRVPEAEPVFTGTIRGRVLDPDGNPVGAGVGVGAGPAVSTCLPLDPGHYASAQTADDGSFLLEGLRPAEFRVSASRRRERTLEAGWAYRIPEGSTEVVIRLAPVEHPDRHPRPPDAPEPSPHEPAPSAVTGRVVLAEGPDRAQWLAMTVLSESSGEERRLRPSPKGVFDTGTLGPGPWTFRVTSSSELVVGEVRGVHAGTRGLQIPVDAHGVIRGRLLLPGGEPAAGVRVSATALDPERRSSPGASSIAETSDDGSFLIEYLGDFEIGVTAWPRRRSETFPHDLAPVGALPLRPGARDVILEFRQRSPVRGTLLSADGTPAPPHRIEALRAEFVRPWEISTEKDGTFEFPDLPPGKVRIVLRWGGRVHELAEPEAPATDLILRLPAR